jgi:hypothetical protein
LLSVLTAVMPVGLFVPLQCVALIVCGVLALAILRELLHAHQARVADSRACTAENLLRLERAEAERIAMPIRSTAR